MSSGEFQILKERGVHTLLRSEGNVASWVSKTTKKEASEFHKQTLYQHLELWEWIRQTWTKRSLKSRGAENGAAKCFGRSGFWNIISSLPPHTPPDNWLSVFGWYLFASKSSDLEACYETHFSWNASFPYYYYFGVCVHVKYKSDGR